MTRLLTSGEEDFDRVSVLKEDTSSTACELKMLILSISVTFSVTHLNYEIMPATLANTLLFILQGSAVDLGFVGGF